MMCGGFTGPQTEVPPEVAEILNSVTPQINTGLAANHTFTVIEYKTQVVAGMNYDFKLRTNDNRVVNVRVFVPLPYTHQPNSVTSVAYE